MKYYSDSQVEILRCALARKPFPATKSNRSDMSHLADEGLILPNVASRGENKLLVEISAKGRAYLKALDVDYARRYEDVGDRRKTRTIAIVALAISALSMLISLISVIISVLR